MLYGNFTTVRPYKKGDHANIIMDEVLYDVIITKVEHKTILEMDVYEVEFNILGEGRTMELDYPAEEFGE